MRGSEPPAPCTLNPLSPGLVRFVCGGLVSDLVLRIGGVLCVGPKPLIPRVFFSRSARAVHGAPYRWYLLLLNTLKPRIFFFRAALVRFMEKVLGATKLSVSDLNVRVQVMSPTGELRTC